MYIRATATFLFWGFYDPRKWIRECEVAMVKRVKDWSPKMRQQTPGSWWLGLMGIVGIAVLWLSGMGAQINPTR